LLGVLKSISPTSQSSRTSSPSRFILSHDRHARSHPEDLHPWPTAHPNVDAHLLPLLVHNWMKRRHRSLRGRIRCGWPQLPIDPVHCREGNPPTAIAASPNTTPPPLSTRWLTKNLPTASTSHPTQDIPPTSNSDTRGSLLVFSLRRSRRFMS